MADTTNEQPMPLLTLGLHPKMHALVASDHNPDFVLARVIIEHRERYVVQTIDGNYSAIITGNLRFTATERADFPAVGDWVSVGPMDEDSMIIYKVLPRFSVLARQAVGQFAEQQIIATNVDFAFLVQACGYDFNINRLERYLVLCRNAEIIPIIILNKTDTISTEEVESLLRQVQERVPNTIVIAMSSHSGVGYDQLRAQLKPGYTYCFLGSSGVGKSTIINKLQGEALITTSHISESTQKGRHTTTSRSLFQLSNGSLVIDTPGMRELGMVEEQAGLTQTFADVEALTEQCKFNDCTHENEQGCAILDAIAMNTLDKDVFHNYQKLQREQARFHASVYEKRQKNRAQGKRYKSIQQSKRHLRE